MRMDDPVPTFTYLISQLAGTHSNLAYLSLVAPHVWGDSNQELQGEESSDFVYDIWNPRPLLLGGWTADPAGAAREADEKGIIALFGRAFIANVRGRLFLLVSLYDTVLNAFFIQPDLPTRLRDGIKLNDYDRKTFYVYGPSATEGYIDYPFANDSKL